MPCSGPSTVAHGATEHEGDEQRRHLDVDLLFQYPSKGTMIAPVTTH
jgi:hypothetical protein